MRQYINPDKFRALFLDLDDSAKGQALKAWKMVYEHSGLEGKSARGLEGQARYRMMEKGFQEICEFHGGRLIEDGVIPNTDLRIFQPFMRFEDDGQGFILALASMPEKGKLPVKNKSRSAGVSMNYTLTPRLFQEENHAKVGDIFVMLLVCRDRAIAGRIEEVALGIVDSGYLQYLSYQSLSDFLSGDMSGSAGREPEDHNDSGDTSQSVKPKLKKNIQPYLPPEIQGDDNDEDEQTG